MRNKNQNKNYGNSYIPFNSKIEEIVQLTSDVRLFRIRQGVSVDYIPGQFFMVSVLGAGEVPISVASLNRESRAIELCIRRAGFVTSAIHSLKVGQTIGLRGPYGKGFPLSMSSGRDVVLVAGGIGIAPLRPLIQGFIEKRDMVGKVMLLYGSKTPDDIIFKDELEDWQKGGIDIVLTVDRGNKIWNGRVGLVTDFWHEVTVNFKNAVAYICGPYVMIRAVMRDLYSFGMPDERIIATLESHMKCGIGKCGHCYVGPKYICTDGPVFSYKEIKNYISL